jgi:FkbM family methyltransferase
MQSSLSYVHSGREIFENRSPFDILKIRSGVIIDAGGAAGEVTKKMLQISPNSSAYVFEPFPGNFPFLDGNLGKDSRVTIVKKALGAQLGRQRFIVAGTVKGHEKGWESMVGYSSGGRLAEISSSSDKDSYIEVDVVRLDDMVNDLPVFMKVDVQGGELNLLKGASSLLQMGLPYIY